MALPIIQSAFTVGEVSPSLYGRADLARYHIGASTMRNFFVSYRGGAYSRAGTAFVGFSKQTGRSYPPRLITFQFSINQGLALEFGNLYMRVISQGAFVTELPLSITGATKANPAVVTVSSSVMGATAATPITTGVSQSYAPGELVTIAGGTAVTPAVVSVTNTKLLFIAVNNPGTAFVPADTVHVSGGVQSTPVVLTVATTKVTTAQVNAGGTGGTNGFQTVTGTTGTGTKFQATVFISGGVALAVTGVTVGGSYTVNPTTLTAEPVTGAGLTGCTLRVFMGIDTLTITNAGVFTTNPSGGTMNQSSTSGSGIGATFQSALMGPNAATIATAGSYTSTPSNPVAQASTTGTGLGVTFTMTFGSIAPYAIGDWVQITGVVGMTQLNNQIYVVKLVVGGNITLGDVYGNNINSTSYSTYISGGTMSRIYTLTTPYAEQDLKYLKFTQSADVMSLCLINQETSTEYAAMDLTRNANNDWTLAQIATAPTVTPPVAIGGQSSAAGNIFYQYRVTSVSPDDGTESVASPILSLNYAVNITATEGTNSINWTPVDGVQEYNVYKAVPGVLTAPPAGSLFGYTGKAYGTVFLDTNIVADFSQVPPLHRNPFERGQIISAFPTAAGSGYTFVGFSITTSTGSGAILQGVVAGGTLRSIVVVDPGKNYGPTDTVTVTGDGSGATARLTIGAQTGTYPAVPSYFQERRVYANTLNNPDTYFMSQPGSYTNFDYRIPTIATDAITGTPWALAVNGIQAMVPTPNGLVILTGLSAWQLTGAGGSAFSPQPITPSSQQALQQAYNGCSPTVPPLGIDWDILYVQAKGSIVRSFTYQINANVYSGTDLTLNSSQLFTGFTVLEWAWCEEPYKVAWAVRDDGILLSLTYLKPQEVAGWARHDTNGLFQSVCSVTEPPVDALYTAVKRFPGTNTAYMIERMNNRLWSSVEDCWCVDSALSLPQPEPNATLTASSATGLGACTGVTGLVGGTNYSAGTTATIVDDNGQGPGTGAVVALTIAGGVITAVTISPQGTGYVRPALVITDTAGTAGGSGASATVTLNNAATFTASTGVFVVGDVGSVIRMGGGIATITAYTSSTVVTANITSPIVKLVPNTTTPQTATSGNWTLTAPTTTITGLNHLAGATVTGLADGKEVTPRTVSATGSVTLDTAASDVTLGLGFTAQLQSLYLDGGDPTVQGQRKKVAAVTVVMQDSAPFKVGTNQPDGAVQSPIQISPTWGQLANAELTNTPTSVRPPYGSTVLPLYTGPTRVAVNGGFNVRGQVAVQQEKPFPLNVLAFVSEFLPGDLPQNKIGGGGQG